jgi:hypothetical protein
LLRPWFEGATQVSLVTQSNNHRDNTGIGRPIPIYFTNILSAATNDLLGRESSERPKNHVTGIAMH